MPVKTVTPSLRSAMERLKHAGSVNGLLLGWRRSVLVNLLPFEPHRVERLMETLQDAQTHFASGEREVETFWFGYDDVFLLAILKGDLTLVMLHSHGHEVDFLHRVAETFFDDAQLLVDEALNPSPEAEVPPSTTGEVVM
jgi:hypothetical protein